MSDVEFESSVHLICFTSHFLSPNNMESRSKDPFSDLEFFNDARFQPPEWAKDFPVASSSSSSRRPGPSGQTDDLLPPSSTHPAFTQRAPGVSGASDVDAPGDVDEDEEEGEDIWADAQEEIHEPPEVIDPTKEFTADELHVGPSSPPLCNYAGLSTLSDMD